MDNSAKHYLKFSSILLIAATVISLVNVALSLLNVPAGELMNQLFTKAGTADASLVYPVLILIFDLILFGEAVFGLKSCNGSEHIDKFQKITFFMILLAVGCLYCALRAHLSIITSAVIFFSSIALHSGADKMLEEQRKTPKAKYH